MQRPLVGIAVLVMKDGKLLLGRRKGSHGENEYASPGGHLEHMESFAACATREVMEETGKRGEPEVREPDKIEGWAWYDLDALPSPLFGTVPTAIEALRGERVCWDAE